MPVQRCSSMLTTPPSCRETNEDTPISAESTLPRAAGLQGVLHWAKGLETDQNDEEPNRTVQNSPKQQLAAVLSMYETFEADHNLSELPSKEFLHQCLRVKKYRQADALIMARNFVRFRTSQRWPLRLRASEVEVALRSNVHWLLEGRDKQGRGVIVFNVRNLDTTCCRVEDYQKMASYCMEVLTRDESVQEEGAVIVLDLAGTTWGHCMCLGLSIQDWHRGISMWSGTFPSKVKAIYLVGCYGMLAHTARFCMLALPAKIQSRFVFVSGDLSELHESISPSVLPPSLGGTRLLNWGVFVDRMLIEEEQKM